LRPTDEANTEERRQQIVRAAISCFNKAGLHGASMAQICKEAGLSAGHLYHYFDGRDALVRAVYEHDWASAQAYLEGLSETANGLAIYLDLVKSKAHPEPEEDSVGSLAFSLEVVAELGRNPELARIHQEHRRNFTARLRKMVLAAKARGELVEGATVEEVMFAIETMSTARTVWAARGADPQDYGKLARTLLKGLLVVPRR